MIYVKTKIVNFNLCVQNSKIKKIRQIKKSRSRFFYQNNSKKQLKNTKNNKKKHAKTI